MKELDISAIPNNPRLNSANDRQYQYYPNKLKRNFLTEAPNLVWVSDITYAKLALILYTCVLSLIYTHVKLWHIVFQNTLLQNWLPKRFLMLFIQEMNPIRLHFTAIKDHSIHPLNFVCC